MREEHWEPHGSSRGLGIGHALPPPDDEVGAVNEIGVAVVEARR
jgi:hypothetical protein